MLLLLACAGPPPPVGTIAVGPGEVAAAQDAWIAAHPDVSIQARYRHIPFLTIGPAESIPPQPPVPADIVVVDQGFEPTTLVGGACFARDCDAGGIAATAGAGTHGAQVVELIRRGAPGARIVGVRVFDARGVMRLVDLLRALDWAADAPPRVLNLSLGLVDAHGAPLLYVDAATCAAANPALAAAVAVLQAEGTVVVAAAGDTFAVDRITVPACLPGVVAVAAAEGDVLAASANRWSGDLRQAPGVDVPVAGTTASGSSLAAAQEAARIYAGAPLRAW